MFKFPTLVTLIVLIGTTSRAAEIPELALQAKAVLEKHCYACHGQNGTNEGGLNFILNRERLVSAGKIVLGNARTSLLWKRMQREEMPPETDLANQPITERPTAEDVATIRKWIEEQAPDFNPPQAERKFVSNTAMLEFMQKDLLAAPERERRFRRYFTITHLYNGGLTDDELASYRAGLSKLVNSLSWGKEIKVPVAVDPAKTIFRIDLRDFNWRDSTWERILAHNPYGVVFDTRAAKECYELTRTQIPFVRADWFVFVASRPPLYHEILEIPTNVVDLEKQLHINVVDGIKDEKVSRAAFNSSGVSRNNRLIERHDSGYGAFWVSYDFASNVGRQNLFEHPLGPGKDANQFKHDGGEIIFNLPNGLQAYLLVNGEGVRIDKGPIEIVSDPKQKDRTVVNGVSCMSCHSAGMVPAKDQIRAHVEQNPAGFSRAEADTIKALYPSKKDFDALLEADSERFRKAVIAAGSQITKTEPVYALAGQFEKELNLIQVAAEAGATPSEFLAALDRSKQLSRVFGPVRIPGGTVQRQVLVEHFGELVTDLLSGGMHIPSVGTRPEDPDYALALQLYEGRGVLIDRNRARHLFRAAAERGHSLAMTFVGDDYQNGQGVAVDKDEAAKWYQKAMPDLKKLAERGDPIAQVQYGFMLESSIGIAANPKEGIAWYRKAAEQGSAMGQQNYGWVFMTGKHVPKDDTEAVRWVRKAADQNYAAGQFLLGLMYQGGNGVSQDDAEAIRWYRKAAEQNHNQAQNYLGFMYHQGRGAPQDYKEAERWFRKAIEQNNAAAQNNLGNMYHEGNGVPKDNVEAGRWYRKAADQNSAWAQRNLGMLYAEGIGVTKDLNQAAFWLRKAAHSDDAEGAKSARDLLKQYNLNLAE